MGLLKMTKDAWLLAADVNLKAPAPAASIGAAKPGIMPEPLPDVKAGSAEAPLIP